MIDRDAHDGVIGRVIEKDGNAVVTPTGVSIALRDVSFAYATPRYIIRHATFDVKRGRVLALLGPNGSGKTTMLRLMANAIPAAAGTVSTYGVIAYVPQFVKMSFAYSVFDVVLMGRARHVSTFSTPSRNDERIARLALERVGMSAFARRRFEELSGGERQLVTFARALAAEADILLLDEPTASLDLRHQQEALRWIDRLAHAEGLTVVFSTHQPQHADVVADDVVLLSGQGDITAGTSSELLRSETLSTLFGVTLHRHVGDDTAAAGILVTNFTL